ncbi:MAG: hypothetical protein ACPH5K_07340 [Polaribacter sp.]
MGKVFNGVTIVALAIIVFWLCKVDYSDMGFRHNMSSYLSIISLALIIVSMQLSRRNNMKKNQ